MKNVKKSILILLLICIIPTIVYAASCDDHDYPGDDGGNQGNHSTGQTCTHGIGDTSYHDYTCYESSSSSGYHMQHCKKECSKDRPKGGNERTHNDDDDCYDCGGSHRCSKCDHVEIHDCEPPYTYIYVPSVSNKTYNGSSQTGVSSGTGYTRSGTYSATNAGTYTAYVTPNSGYCWSDGSTSRKTLTWSISKANIGTVSVSMSGYTYGGTKSTPSVSGNTSGGAVTYYYNTSNSTSGGSAWSGVTSSTSLNAGTYYMYAKVAATTNYNAKTSSTKSFTISKASLTKPSVSGTYTYNGTSQTVSLSNFNSSTMNISGNTRTNAGSQNVTVSLKNTTNYKWSDGTTANVTLTFTIAKKSVAVSWGTTTTFTYNGSAQAPTASASSGVTGETLNITRTTGTAVGNYTSTASLSSVTGGQASTGNYTLTGTTKAFSITNLLLTKPSINGTYTYNGSSQTVTLSNFNSTWMNVTGNARTNAGSQTVTVTLKDGTNVKWSDGSNSSVTLTFTINKKSVATVWGTTTTFTYNGSAQAPTASASSGVTGETLNITRTTAVAAGDYTSTASISSVTGGQASKDNYTLTNTTKAFTINRAAVSPQIINMSSYQYGKTLPNPSVSGNSGGGTVTIYYNTSNSTSGGSNWANVTNSTYINPGAYWMYGTIAQTSNYNAATTPTVKFIVGQPPTVTINSNTTYKKSQTATITIYDPDKDLANMDNDKYLQQSTIIVYYAWTQSTATPASYPSSVSIPVNASTSSVSTTITKNTDDGIWYLHIKTTVKDMLGYTTDAQTYGTFYLDNTKPVITLIKPSQVTYYDKADSIEILLEVTDKHSSTNEDAFTADDINLFVAGTALQGNKKLEQVSYNSATGIRRYKLTLTNVQGTGYITMNIPAGAVADNTADSASLNDAVSFGIDDVKIFVDNTIPVIELTDEITIVTPTEKIDLDNPKDAIDSRYINKDYEIEMPFTVTDVGTDIINTNILEASDIKVLVNGNEVSVNKKELVQTDYTTTSVTSTRVVTHVRKYLLTLKGIPEDGYISIAIDNGGVTDLVGNNNVIMNFEPYTKISGNNIRVFVDNTKPAIRVIQNDNLPFVGKDTPLEFVLQIVDNGSGITEKQFILADLIPQINGVNASIDMNLTKDSSNNYTSVLGSDVSTNYTYTLKIDKIDFDGVLRILVAEDSIVDKANNGIDLTTLPTAITVDIKGPTIGDLITNADEYGRIVDDITELLIDNCSDPSGIEKYEWQVSKDGINWETIDIDETSLPKSETTHQIEEETDMYYRVIVSDTLGNSTTSEVVKVTFLQSIDRKPTIRFETEQTNNKEVEIQAIIKATSDIVSVTVNGIVIDSDEWTVTRDNMERTVVVPFTAITNGIYQFKATDSRGNVVTGEINVSTIEDNIPTVNAKAENATIINNATIIFTSDTPIKPVEPNKYPGITFDITDRYVTRVTATIDRGVDFTDDKVFKFETNGKTQIDKTVEGPIITDVVFLRFAEETPSAINVTANEAKSLANGISTTKNAQNKSYYGFKNSNLNVSVASSSELDAAETLGRANKVYVLTANGERKDAEASIETVPTTSSSYVNGNVTGMYNKTAGLLEYSEAAASGSTKYQTFRAVIKN